MTEPQTSPTGVIHAQVLDGRGGLRLLDHEQLDHWVPAQGVLWAHFDRKDKQTARWLESHSQLDPLILHALLTEDTRPRMTPLGDGVVLILRGVNLNPGSTPDDMISLRMWVDQDRLLSMRLPRLLAVEDVHDRLEHGHGPHSSGSLLSELAIALAGRMEPVITNLRDLLDDFEEQALDGYRQTVQDSIAPIRRQVIALRRYLAPQRDALLRLLDLDLPWLDDTDRLRIHEAIDRTTRFVEDLESLRERFVFVQEELMARQSQQLNNTMYLLSIVSTVFLPLSFLTGVLGMNVAGMPGTETHWAFWAVAILMFMLLILELILLWWWRILGHRG